MPIPAIRAVARRRLAIAWVRGPMQVCQYPRGGLPVADQADGLWARRSRFSRGPLSVLVAEVFLPNLWAALSARSENN